MTSENGTGHAHWAIGICLHDCLRAAHALVRFLPAAFKIAGYPLWLISSNPLLEWPSKTLFLCLLLLK